jgi:Flp pilus assembly protein TadG
VNAGRRGRRSERDRGSAAVDFVLVGSLVTLMFMALVQLGVDYHVRNVLAACVAEGARYAANADVADPAAGAARANDLIAQSLGSGYAHAEPAAVQDDVGGVPAITLTAHARLPLVAWFLPVGPTVQVTGHALVEPR